MIEAVITDEQPTPKVKKCYACQHEGPVNTFRKGRNICLGCSNSRAYAGKAAKLTDERRRESAKYMRDYAEKNREKLSGYIKCYYEKNKELLKARARQHRADNLNARRAAERNYRKTAAGKAVRKNSNRRRRSKIKGPGISSATLAVMMAASKRCPYCLLPYTRTRIKSLDHIMPIIRGGTHTEDNILICCTLCNSTKQAMHPNDWAKRIGLLLI